MLKQILLFFSAAMLSAAVYAGENPNYIADAYEADLDNPGGDVDAPFDGGLSLLIAGGVAYGISRARNKNVNVKR